MPLLFGTTPLDRSVGVGSGQFDRVVSGHTGIFLQGSSDGTLDFLRIFQSPGFDSFAKLFQLLKKAFLWSAHFVLPGRVLLTR